MRFGQRVQTNPMGLLENARRRLPASAAFSGLTAAWLHGMDVVPCNPIEVTVPEGAGVSGRAGMILRRSTFARGDVVDIRSLRATSSWRTVAEICSRLDLVEAVVIADAALHMELTTLGELAEWAVAHGRRRGIRQFRRVLKFAEPASESPMESRLRMVLMLGRLPRPQAHVSVRDATGRIIGRPDLYYERQRLGIEYDWETHRDAMPEDNRRQNLLLGAGVRPLRFTAGDVYGNPASVVAQVRGQLATAGGRAMDSRQEAASAGARR